MEGQQRSSTLALPSWWQKAVVSVGTAAAVVAASYRFRRHLCRASSGGCEALSTVATLAVVPRGDSKASAMANVVGDLVTPVDLGGAVGGRESVAIFCSDVVKFEMKFDMVFLQQCLDKLVPGGTLTAQLVGVSEVDAQGFETAGLFAGALDSKVTMTSTSVTFSCSKPTWAAGAAAQLSNSEVDHIQEDDLLGEVPAPMGQGKSDCSSKPRACAGCSCGRKDLEDKHGAEEAKKMLEQGKTRSKCGSCYLGDAFRCDSCPYRGLPAFKGGSKVELSVNETQGTGQFEMNVDADEGGTITEGGKLVIEA
eukprot:TRINITY_DN14355_c0_g1_i1.p1 TRINITY_DN14355_c0_g1~~TRINITY_DN14355_c0_g1_i1.p1  ORF type:complete len:309 (+),score=70.66 TRINITY_DN14355_c0_g1_i1:131-1057(+)